MKKSWLSFAAAGAVYLAFNAQATTHYVDLNCTNPVSPYTNWINAATNIQDAIDVAPPHALILVTNGVYTTGGRAMPIPVPGYLTNRVALYKPVTVQSLNGPAVTVIQGFWDSTTNGPLAVRCAWLIDGAVLSGFTLRSGATYTNSVYTDAQFGGGVYSSSNGVVTNCVITGNAAYYQGGGGYGGNYFGCVISSNYVFHGDGGGNSHGVLTNCTLVGNSAFHAGGGIFSGSATGCVFIANSAGEGGGAVGNLYNCTVISNTANIGGGVWSGTAVSCLISGNSAMNAGGGAYWSTLFNCVVTNNCAAYGGGIYSIYNYQFLKTAHNCLIISNSASSSGGGAYYANLNNCTVVGNSAQSSGGGVAGAYYYNNCIIYYNTAPSGSNYGSGVNLADCCTTPAPYGAGNITNEPAFANPAGGDFRLQPNSPCINSGNNAYVTSATDLDDNLRIMGGTVDMGAYECQSPALLAYYIWLQGYGLPTNTPEIYNDSDGDGMNNWQEWMTGTDPTNALSLLEMLSLASTESPSGIVVTWQSVTNRTYFLQRSGDLAAQPPFSNIQSDITGQAGTTTYTDTSATNGGPYFYRVGVQ